MSEPGPTPPFTRDLPGIGGVVKATPETFVVEEIAAYEPCGEGQHLYLWVEKRGVAAHELVERIAARFDVSANDVGMAGNKDRHALTRQWLSIPSPADGADVLGPVGDGIEILRAAHHRNKLKTGHLRGNRFVLEVRELAVEPPVAVARASAILDVLAERGFPNYFGAQRFGRGGSTLDAGLALLRGERTRALQKKRFRRLAASAVQSAVFNEVVRLRIEAGTTHRALLGDRLNRTTERGQLFVTAACLAQAQQGIDSGSLAVTGPMWGPKMYEVADDALAVELRALERWGLAPRDFSSDARMTPGTRRDLFARFLDPPWCEAIGGGLRLGFSLPSGAYATVVLAELTKMDFSAWEAP